MTDRFPRHEIDSDELDKKINAIFEAAEQREKSENEKRLAGVKSGERRKNNQSARRSAIVKTFQTLPKSFQKQPSSEASLSALMIALEAMRTNSPTLFRKFSRATLVKDLQALRIRSRRKRTI